MNDKFYNLPKQKQNTILNAGYRVFSENSYKKSPMSEIAKEAGISKSLLFHYFNNKKEFYLYLYNYVFTFMREIAEMEIADIETDFFEMFLHSSKLKCKLLERHEYSYRFIIKTFYEDDEEVAAELIGKNTTESNNGINNLLGRIEKNRFKDGLDILQLINVITWCLEGLYHGSYSRV